MPARRTCRESFCTPKLSRPPVSPSVSIRTGWGKGSRALGTGNQLSKTGTRRPSFFREGTGLGIRLLASGSPSPQSLLALLPRAMAVGSLRRFCANTSTPQASFSTPQASFSGHSGGTAADLHRIPCFPRRATPADIAWNARGVNSARLPAGRGASRRGGRRLASSPLDRIFLTLL